MIIEKENKIIEDDDIDDNNKIIIYENVTVII